MFNRIEIENYKSIANIRLENISDFNVFFGKNNCGKSSLLEAVFLLSSPNLPFLFLNCNKFRGYNKISDFSYFFNNLDKKRNIKLTGQGNDFYNRQVVACINDEFTKILNSESLSDINSERLDLDFIVNEKIYKSSFSIRQKENLTEDGIVSSVPESEYKEEIRSCFMPSNYSFGTLLETVKNIFREKKEEQLIELMKNFDDKIQDIILVGDEIMVNTGLPYRIPLNFLGDGIRKIFSIVANIVWCKNGVLLIDEIDNGVHFSIMNDLWKGLLNIAHQNNTQVFATTHNIDSLKGICNYIEDNNDANISFYKIIHRKDSTNKVINYSAQNFKEMLLMENEIR